jgi:hypothetical protein
MLNAKERRSLANRLAYEVEEIGVDLAACEPLNQAAVEICRDHATERAMLAGVLCRLERGESRFATTEAKLIIRVLREDEPEYWASILPKLEVLVLPN